MFLVFEHFSDFHSQFFLTLFLIVLILWIKYLPRPIVINITYFLVCEIRIRAKYTYFACSRRKFWHFKLCQYCKTTTFHATRSNHRKNRLLKCFCKKQKSQPYIILNPTHHGVFETSPVMGGDKTSPPIFFGNYILHGVLVVEFMYIPIKQVCMTIFRPPWFSPAALWWLVLDQKWRHFGPK